MEPIHYLRSLRRRWPVVVASILLAMVAAWFALPSEGPTGVPEDPTYRATTILLTDQTGAAQVHSRTGGGSSTPAVALTTIGEVPERVAEELNYDGDPEDLADLVNANVDEAGLMRITATAETERRAERIADTFAEQLILYLEARERRAQAEALREARQQARRLEEESQALEEQIATASPSDAGRLRQQQEQKAADVAGIQGQLQAGSVVAPVSGAGLEVIEPAEAELVVPEGGPAAGVFQLPKSGTARLLIGAVFGLVVGIVLAFLLDRFDRRLRTKEAAEKSFDAPVLAEIPRMRRRQRGKIVTLTEPRSPAAEAFRVLGTTLSHGWGGNEKGVPEVARRNRRVPGTVLVTSAGHGEGKTTVVANLAASLGELGHRVMVISCDFQQPRIHQLFEVDDQPGLVEALRSSNGRPVLEGRVRQTEVDAVQVVPSDASPERPAELLASENMHRVLTEARRSSDVVLLDTPPVLTVSDAAQLLDEADAVVVVAQAGKTTTEVAGMTAAFLRRLNGRSIAVALNQATEIRGPRAKRQRRKEGGRRGNPPLARHQPEPEDVAWG